MASEEAEPGKMSHADLGDELVDTGKVVDPTLQLRSWLLKMSDQNTACLVDLQRQFSEYMFNNPGLTSVVGDDGTTFDVVAIR